MFNERALKNRMTNANAAITYLNKFGFDIIARYNKADYRIYHLFLKKRVTNKKGYDMLVREHAAPIMTVCISLDDFVIIHLSGDDFTSTEGHTINNNEYGSINKFKEYITGVGAKLIANRAKCIKSLNKHMSENEKAKNNAYKEFTISLSNDTPKVFDSLSEEE